MTDIVELGRHTPSVESVISRLGRHKDKIRSITCIIEYNKGEYQIASNEKSYEELCYEGRLYNIWLDNIVCDSVTGVEEEV